MAALRLYVGYGHGAVPDPTTWSLTMETLYYLEVLASHDFDEIRHRSVHTTEDRAHAWGNAMIANLLSGDPDTEYKKYRVEVTPIELIG